ncbi:MAG TPA: hypothetical protein VJ695_04355 [Nitrososphaera sp.]|nr:hypothetical protein [Nitrososphaera sp.]
MSRPQTSHLITSRILDAALRSAGPEHFGGTIQSRIALYSRVTDQDLRKHLSDLVRQGLLSTQECTLHNYQHHTRRIFPKRRARATKIIYRVTSAGYEWLRNHEEQEEQRGIAQINYKKGL